MLNSTLDSLDDWNNINWKLVNKEVTKLKSKIWKARKFQEFKKLRNYQKLIVHSSHNILFSIRKVTQQNTGSKTEGIDEELFTTPKDRLELFFELKKLNLNNYTPLATKRIYIPKPDGRQRPIGIPTIRDRVIQQIVKNALEPEWESIFEPSSYGFRPSRSVNDAINRLFLIFNSKNSRQWIVDADITGCFDNIDHNYLLNQIKQFPYKGIISKWLKSGIIHENVFFENEEFGTPQGSIISPLLSNIALHGMESELGVKLVNVAKHYVKTGSRSFVRYADDFVVICYTKEDAEKVIQELGPILSKRGLSLSAAKTNIKHITEGFDFLGFNIRREPQDGFARDYVFIKNLNDSNFLINYEKSLIIIKPSDKSIKNFKTSIKETFDKFKGDKAGIMIKELNSKIRGWAQSKYHWHCNRTFHKLDSYLFNLQIRWMKRMHPSKNWSWLVAKYYKHKIDGRINNKWVFHANLSETPGKIIDLDLLQLKWFPHTDWVMLAHSKNPLNKEDYEYF